MRRSTSWSWTLSTSERQVRGRSADLPSTPDDEPLVVPLSRFKTGLAFAGSVGFVLLGVWLTGFEPPRAVLAGWLAIVVFGLFGAIGFVRLVAGGFAVRADARGIEDLSSPVGAGLVPWEEIEQVRTLEPGAALRRSLHEDPEVVLRRQRNPLKRAAMRFNVRRAGTAVLIPSVVVPEAIDDLAAALERRRQLAGCGGGGLGLTGEPGASRSATHRA